MVIFVDCECTRLHGHNFLGFVLPVSQCDLNLTTSEKGILASATYVGIICSSHLWGFLADTKGRRYVIRPTLLFVFILSAASSFVQNFYQFAVLRFLGGFLWVTTVHFIDIFYSWIFSCSLSGSSATIYAYLSEFHDIKHRDRAIMISSVIFAIACNGMPLLCMAILSQEWEFHIDFLDITYKPWRLFIVICSLSSLLSFLILCFLPESPKCVINII